MYTYVFYLHNDFHEMNWVKRGSKSRKYSAFNALGSNTSISIQRVQL